MFIKKNERSKCMFATRTALRRSLIVLLLLAFGFSSLAAAPAQSFPDVISLPDGFQPEGIASGNGTTFYAGSIATGQVYRGDLRTGQGSVLVPPQAGRSSVGLKFDAGTALLFVAGGPTGNVYVYDGQTGVNVATIPLTNLPSFINDVIITNDAAYFTNSNQPEFYRVPIEQRGQTTFTSEAIPLSGDYQFDSTPGAFNANGIAATPDGKALIIVNSVDGALYKVDPNTGVATRIDLGGATVANGDGLLLQGKTLYVVQNFFNQIAVVDLSTDFTSGAVVDNITSSAFRIPTTIARFGSSLYAINARFDTPPTPDTKYEIVRVPRN
jgi:sugar lactone lactonase YvrE